MRSVLDNGGYVGYFATYGKPPVVTNVAQSGLVLWLDAGQQNSYSGSGATWKDISPTNLSAALTNTTFSSTNGGGSFYFNGSASASIPNSTALDSQSITCEVWGRAGNVQQIGFWMEKGTVNSQYSLFLYSNTIYWRIWGVADVTVTASSVLNNNQWFHVVGTTTSGAQRLYVNSTQRASAAGTSAIPTSTAGFSVGNANGANPSGYPYTGDIAVVRVYNRALSAAEVLGNYNDGRARFGL